MRRYSVWLLFAERPSPKKTFFACETCQVLFRCKSAVDAYDQAFIWGKAHVGDGKLRMVGVEHISEILGNKIESGSEIGGKFYSIKEVWKRRDEFVPPKREVKAIYLEANMDQPVGEQISNQTKRILKHIFDE